MSTAKNLIDILKEDVKGSNQKTSRTYIKLVEVFPLQPINSKAQHTMALRIVERLISYTSEEGADDGVELYLRTLTELAADYERKQFKMGPVRGAEMPCLPDGSSRA